MSDNHSNPFAGIHPGYLRIWILLSLLWVVGAVVLQWQALDWPPTDQLGLRAWCRAQPGASYGLYDLKECDRWAHAQNMRALMAVLWVLCAPALGFIGLVAVPRVSGWIKSGFDKPYDS